MRRFRWSLLFLAVVVVIGASASVVLAGAHTSKATMATYWNNVVQPSTSSGTSPVHYLDTALWKFDVPGDMYAATEADLNFHANVQSIQDGGGSGFGATLSVTVKGNSTATYTVTLTNPWRPHVAYSNDPSYGQDAFASLKIPTYIWKGASSLTITAKSMSSNTIVGFDDSGLLIGYVTLG